MSLDKTVALGAIIQRLSWLRVRARGAAALAVALAVPVTVLVQSSPEQSRGGGWSTVMGDLGNRYSTLEQINLQNVSRLGAAWVSERLTPPANSRSMTVVRNGMMYFTAPPNVMKLNARTGQVVWRFAAGGGGGRGGSASAPPAMGAPDREGVALGDGLVFIGTSDARVVALRDDTGELVWNRYVGEDARDKGQGIAGAPVYAGGIVSVGLSGDNGWRGQVVGLDGKTGREVWRWFAVPAPGEPGSETWPKTAQWKFGGGALWLAGVADEEAGLVYYVTGNGVPQLSGEHREGNNLFICSIVALDMKTGKLKWHYQTIRHDIWEADMSISPVLFDAQVGGRTRKGDRRDSTDGYVFTFDRDTGKPLTKIEERKVPQDRVPEDGSDAAVSCWRRRRAAGLRLVEEDTADPQRLRGGVLLRGRLARQTKRADAVLRNARRADVLQPADRILLRRR